MSGGGGGIKEYANKLTLTMESYKNYTHNLIGKEIFVKGKLPLFGNSSHYEFDGIVTNADVSLVYTPTRNYFIGPYCRIWVCFDDAGCTWRPQNISAAFEVYYN